MSCYLNPYKGFGFKKLFGEEGKKDSLTDFLNQLLPPKYQVAYLYLKKTENLSDLPLECKVASYCSSQ